MCTGVCREWLLFVASFTIHYPACTTLMRQVHGMLRGNQLLNGIISSQNNDIFYNRHEFCLNLPVSDGYVKKSNLKNYCMILSLLHRGFGKTCPRESVIYNIQKAEVWIYLVWVVSYLCIFNATEMVISYFIFILCFYYCFN